MDYKNGKIYKIECKDGSSLKIYIGSTVKHYLSSRLAEHVCDYYKHIANTQNRVRNMTSFQLFEAHGVKGCKISLIENFPCNSKAELEKREAHFIRENLINVVNKQIPQRTKQEYYIENIDKIRAYTNSIKDRKREYDRLKAEKTITCLQCNCIVKCVRLKEHQKTKKHINCMAQDEEEAQDVLEV